MDDDTLAVWRYCFQRILVPCVVIIGVLGNIVSVIVLTRFVKFFFLLTLELCSNRPFFKKIQQKKIIFDLNQKKKERGLFKRYLATLDFSSAL
jgi:hypothetical protein